MIYLSHRETSFSIVVDISPFPVLSDIALQLFSHLAIIFNFATANILLQRW
jgi:hypothetical protein